MEKSKKVFIAFIFYLLAKPIEGILISIIVNYSVKNKTLCIFYRQTIPNNFNLFNKYIIYKCIYFKIY